jgi:hypothetical protein
VVVQEERQGKVTEWCCCESEGGFWTNPECVLWREEEREREREKRVWVWRDDPGRWCIIIVVIITIDTCAPPGFAVISSSFLGLQ